MLSHREIGQSFPKKWIIKTAYACAYEVQYGDLKLSKGKGGGGERYSEVESTGTIKKYTPLRSRTISLKRSET